MAPETKLLNALNEFVPSIGGTFFYRGPSIDLGGACAACPLEITNETRGIHSEAELEVNPYYCPVRGRCPLYRAFLDEATFLRREYEGMTIDGELVNTGRPRHGWPVACDGFGSVFENVPVFGEDEDGRFYIARWQECHAERDIYLVSKQVFPFRIVLEDVE
jgi:hypothetical protein